VPCQNQQASLIFYLIACAKKHAQRQTPALPALCTTLTLAAVPVSATGVPRLDAGDRLTEYSSLDSECDKLGLSG
jgi:hypothetical protein